MSTLRSGHLLWLNRARSRGVVRQSGSSGYGREEDEIERLAALARRYQEERDG